MTISRSVGVLGSTAFLVGCAVGPSYVLPDIPVPSHFLASKESDSVKVADTAAPASITRWWRALHDSKLNALVERAVIANPDIEIALSRVQAARENEVVVLGAALPQVGIASAVAGSSGLNPTKGRVPQSLNSGVNTAGFESVSMVSGFDASWELDLFGKYRRELQAARDDTEAAIELRNAVLITVIADVARNYIALRGLQAQVTVVRDNITRAEKTVDLVQTRYDRGLTSEYDVTSAKRELGMLQASLPPLTSGITDAESRIAVLLGTFAEDLRAELGKPGKIPHTPERIRPGQPVDLLRRRPEIRQAERQLAAATARIGVATADLFPRFSLIAGLGLQGGPAAAGFTRPFHAPLWSLGPGAYWPVLDFGRLDALIDIADFQAHELLANYKKTILAAVGEVDTAIQQYRADLQRLRDLGVALDESRRSVDLATDRYERGLTDILDVLDAQRQEYVLADQYTFAQQVAAVEFVALYKALGGGWELYQAIPPAPEPQPAIQAAFRRVSNDWK